MKKLLILYLLLPFLCLGQGKSDLVNSYMKLINSDTLIDLFFTNVEGKYLTLAPPTFENYGLDYASPIDKHEFDSLVHKKFYLL
jgi:hypothetical protein